MAKAEELQSGVGDVIKQLRTARGLSMRRLAEMANVNASTLSRWESQKKLPRVPELEAVLDALEASSAQRKTLLHRMDASRSVLALRRLQDDTALSSFHGPRSSRADLLWAMRQRRGWTQGEAARAAGVAQSQVARWESGDTWPDGQKLHALCWGLGADPEEVAALTAASSEEPSSRTIAGRVMPDVGSSMDLTEWMDYLERILFRTGANTLLDLSMLAIENRLWMQAEQQVTAAKALLPAAYAVHARLHLSNTRLPQAAYFGERGLAVTHHAMRTGGSPLASPNYSLWFGNVISVVATANPKSMTRQRHAVRLMKHWLPMLPNRTDGQWAWGLGTVAPLLARLGHYDEAIAFGAQSCDTRVSPQRGDVINRCIEYLRLMIDINRPREGVKILALGEELEPTLPAYLRLRFRQTHDEFRHALTTP